MNTVMLNYHLTFPSSYFRMLPPEVYTLPHQNFSKSIAVTFDLVCALFMCLHSPYGTHFLTVFVSVNLQQRFGNISQHFISNWHSLPPPSDLLPSASDSTFFILVLYKPTYLLTYLLSNRASDVKDSMIFYNFWNWKQCDSRRHWCDVCVIPILAQWLDAGSIWIAWTTDTTSVFLQQSFTDTPLTDIIQKFGLVVTD